MTNTTFNQRQPQKQSTFLKSNPVLRKVTNTAERADSTSCATYKGILIKTLYFLATTVVGFVLFLFLSPMLAFGQHIQSGFFGFYIPQIMVVGVAAIVGLITPFIAIFASCTTPITGTLYTLSQGILIAAISVFYNGAYSGLIMWATVITLVIIFTMLLLYTSGKIKATEKFKSATLALLLSTIGISILAFPDSGEITLFGGEPLNTARNKIGSLIEFPSIYKNCTAYENMKRMAILTGSSDKSVRKILDFVGLGNTGNKKAGQFSLGMRQRLGIAMALLGNPELLILDEPINGLVPTGIMEIRDLIIRLNTEKKITFMISSHLLEELSKIATQYGFIHDGKLIEEISAVELSQKCSDRVLIVPDNSQKAAEILSKIMPPQQIHIYNNSVYLDSMIDRTGQINKYLVENGVTVNQISIHAINLEEYFLRKVGA